VLKLNPDVPISRQTPPTFLLQAENDSVESINNSLVYYIGLGRSDETRRNLPQQHDCSVALS
jgi:hypothetical protein